MTLLAALQAVATDADVKEYTKFSCVKLAIYVTREDPGATDHTDRLTLAQAILNNPDAFVDRFGLGVVANQVLLGISDILLDATTVDTQVNAIYSSFYLS